MLRVSKLADYATILLAHMAKNSGRLWRTGDLADKTKVTLPTVRKLLKILANAKIVRSERGANGGYFLARDPSQVSIGQILRAIEGPGGMTECSHGDCSLAQHCEIQSNWQLINHAIGSALDSVSLASLCQPMELSNIDVSRILQYGQSDIR